MSTNDKQTAPERTAMQEAIEIVAAVRDQYDPKYSDEESRYWELYSIVDSLEELRDTVEKEQLVRAHLYGVQKPQCEGEYPDGERYYNEKHTNHGK